ncbi:class I SAM-dependent RNA methyltransferase [Oligoflexus tunisiensis]|uniref:class I SAM-dependent RNA methyltransferase n=1 Tax=Oligoflexus tunisiensis TaxID=708132 RepID=UPI00114CFB55|nr:class I SAM-dependent RNA methyltransferase [Oligoflexus tunisiensis]
MKAACRFFGKCSGCSLQQFPYVKQLFDKTRAVRLQLGRFVPAGKNMEDVIHPIVPSPAEFGYRTSSKLCLHEDELGRRSIGLYARGTKKVVDIPGCPIHHPAINKLIQKLFGPGQPIPAPFYQHSRRGFQPGRLKFLTIRYSPETDSFGLILSHTGVPRADLEAWAQRLRGLQLSIYESLIQREDEDLVISRDVKFLAGDPVFTYGIEGRRYALDPMAFFQANSSLVTTFIQHIVEGLSGDELLDLYGGFGTYTMAAAPAFKKIHLVEANPHATEAAAKVAREAGLLQVQCSAAAVEDVLKKLLRGSASQKITHMIVNPPRGGLSPQVLTALSQSGWQRLQRLHYVSCNMETLQRDLQVLTRQGFEVESITPFDMFPQTDHVELVAKLCYRGAQKANPTRALIASNRAYPRANRSVRSSRRMQTRS